MKKFMALSIVLGACALAFWFWPRSIPIEDLPVVDIDVGEPMIDVMDRSTYDFRFKIIPPISFSVPLAAYESKRDGYYFLRLRNGDQLVQFPWFPAYADIDVTTGQTEGMEIEFLNYPISVPENRGDMSSSGGGGLVVGDLATERQATIDIYFLLDSLKMQRLETGCSVQNFELLPPCSSNRAISQRHLTANILEEEFDRFVADWEAFWAQNDWDADEKPPLELMIARWISDREAIVNMSVHPELSSSNKKIPYIERERTFGTQINIENTYSIRRAIHLGSCSGGEYVIDGKSQFIFDDDIRYTLEQARVIYGAMLDKMGPLRDDNGDPITDPVVLNDIMNSRDHRMRSRLIRNSWGEVPANADRGKGPAEGVPDWCAMVKDLEQELGYEGP